VSGFWLIEILNLKNFELQILEHSEYVTFRILIVHYIASVMNACLGILSYRDCACRDFVVNSLVRSVTKCNEGLYNSTQNECNVRMSSWYVQNNKSKYMSIKNHIIKLGEIDRRHISKMQYGSPSWSKVRD
jgi:hypothetical protein